MTDHHRSFQLTRRFEHGVPVSEETGVRVANWKIHRHHPMAPRHELGLDQIPTPGTVIGPVNQDEFHEPTLHWADTDNVGAL